jgi:hypothetical protein
MTYLYKIVFTRFWIGGFVIITTLMYVAPDIFEGDDVREIRHVFLLATLVGSVFIYWALARLKKVTLSGDSLIISNFKVEISVPFKDIERISGSILVSPELAWLHFRQPTEFGTKVVFMPQIRWFGGFTVHPIVQELKELSSKMGQGAA